ncbi:acyl-CoA synthetase FdrA, partial [Laribacter hongkongensis]|nr:acyl-CoA synthetase FdrA [Laribacter hongkongensis]
PAGEIARAVAEAQARRAGKSPLVVIATVTGTREDPQDLEAQMEVLEDAGVVLADNVQSAILLAHRLLETGTASEGSVPALFDSPARVVNIGLRGFAEDLHKNGTAVVQLQWAPTAGGNERLQRLLAQMV